MQQPESDQLSALAAAVADGRLIDWDSLESSAHSDDERAAIRRLRAIAAIGQAHAELTFSDTLSESLSVRTVLQGTEDASTPANWGSLRILERVGRGRFGDVYRAWDPTLDREVALKLLRRRDVNSSSVDHEVIEEGRLMARVRHPNVITIYGAQRIDGRTGLWMEFVQGRTLEAELKERGPIPINEVIQIGIELCRALSAVHDASLVHRDVKAHNVLRDSRGRIVLGDFGTGKESSDGAAPGPLAGTPAYLAPEVLDGAAATRQSDIYSLGVLLFRLLAANYPVPGRSLSEIRIAHSGGKRVTISDVRADVPATLGETIERALAPRPTDRFESAAEMERALAACVGARAHRPALAAAAVVVSAVVLVAVWHFGSDLWSEQPSQDADVRSVATRVAGGTSASEMPAAGGVPAPETSTGELEASTAAPIRLNAGDWILVAAIENRTGEEVLDGTIEAAIKRELEYSEFIRVAQRDRVEDALRVLGQPIDSDLDRGLARKISVRDGSLRAALAGSVDKVDGSYVITVDVLRPDDNRAVTSMMETVPTQRAILPAVRKQVLGIREALGEPAAAVDRSRTLLASTHLPSIEALSLYTRAVKAMSLRAPATGQAGWAAIERLTRQAIEEDPMFARATVMLGYALGNQRRPQEEYLPYFERAFKLADTSTPQERYFIIGSFHQRAPGGALTSQRREELERAVAAYEALFKLQPDHYDLRNNLRIAYGSLGRDKDLAWMNLRLAEALPLSVTENLAVANRLLREGNWDGARRYAARAESALSPGWAAAPSLSPGSTAVPSTQAAAARLFSAYIAWLQDDPREALKIADRVQSTSRGLTTAERREVYSRLWLLYAALGRLRQAEHTIEALRGTDGASPNDKLQSDLAEAQFLLISNQPARLRELMEVRARQPLAPDTPPYYAARIDYFIEAGLLEAAERDLEWFKQRGNTGIYENHHAALERALGHPEAAIIGIQKAKTFVSNPNANRVNSQGQYAASELAFALESVGRLSEAIDVLEDAGGDRVGVVMENTLGRWLRGRAQLARLYRKNGQGEKARELEAHLLKLLALADAGHPLMQELRVQSAPK